MVLAILTVASPSTAISSSAPSHVLEVISHKWSGFVDKDELQTDLHGALGTWTVPKVTCTSGENSKVAVWVGIGGDYLIRKGDPEVLYQDGTDSDCEKGQPTYYAWQQQFGGGSDATAIPLKCPSATPCVHWGDTISASIVDRGLLTHWSLADFRNGRRVWTHSSSWKTVFQHRHSAECIVEAPGIPNGEGALFPLPHFGTVTFSSCQTVDQSGKARSIDARRLPKNWTFSELELKQGAAVVARPYLDPLRVFQVAAHRSTSTTSGPLMAYVTNNENTVTPVNLTTGSVGSPIAVLSGAVGPVFIAPNGQTGYVANGSGTDGEITPINLSTDTAGQPIHIGYPGAQSMAFASDGTTAYVSGADYLTPVTLATGTVGTPIDVSAADDGVFTSPDGNTVYALGAQPGVGQLTSVAVASNHVGYSISTPAIPGGMIFSRDGSTAYVVCSEANVGEVVPIDLPSRTLGSPIQVGVEATHPIETPDGRMAYVQSPVPGSGGRSGELTPVDLETRTAGRPIVVPAGIDDFAIAPDGQTAFVATGSDIIAVSLATGGEGKEISVPSGAFEITLAP
jgi:hypothetical protein